MSGGLSSTGLETSDSLKESLRYKPRACGFKNVIIYQAAPGGLKVKDAIELHYRKCSFVLLQKKTKKANYSFF